MNRRIYVSIHNGRICEFEFGYKELAEIAAVKGERRKKDEN